MKSPKSRKYGSNIDEKETYLPKQYGREDNLGEISRK